MSAACKREFAKPPPRETTLGYLARNRAAPNSTVGATPPLGTTSPADNTAGRFLRGEGGGSIEGVRMMWGPDLIKNHDRRVFRLSRESAGPD